VALAKVYMENTKVEYHRIKGKTTLYELAFDDIAFRGGLNQADENFPWYQTEVRGPDDANDEPPRGSKGGHNLSLMRAQGTKKDILFSIPDPRKLNFDFFNGEESPIRTGRKIKFIKPGPLNENGRPDNPFVYTLCGWLITRGRQDEYDMALKGGYYFQGMRGYRPKDITQKTTTAEAGKAVGSPTVHDIMYNAYESRCISLEEWNWIYTNILVQPQPINKSL
jgi:hypothetical protein